MTTLFDKFNKQFGGEEIAKEVKEYAERGDLNYEEVPYGVYEVIIDTMQLTTSNTDKDGNIKDKSKDQKPMLSVWFQVVDGKHKDSLIFMNQLVDAAFKIHIANEFLKSLDSDVDIKFDGDYNHYANLINDVYSDIMTHKLSYQLRYKENSKGFREYKIEEVFEN